LKIKLKGHHLHTIEVIEEEPQAVLSTLTEHDFQDAIKKKETLGMGIRAGGDYFEDDGGQ
jgi:hypothetical protein